MQLDTIVIERKLIKLFDVITKEVRLNGTMMVLLGLAALGVVVWLFSLIGRHPLRGRTVARLSAVWLAMFAIQILVVGRGYQRSGIDWNPFRWLENGTLHESMVLSALMNLMLYGVIAKLAMHGISPERRGKVMIFVWLGVTLLAVAIEAMQFAFARGTCAVEDAIMGCVGAFLGCLITLGSGHKVRKWMLSLFLLLCAGGVAAGMFFLGGPEKINVIQEASPVLEASIEHYSEEKAVPRTVDNVTEDAVVVPDLYNTGVNNIHVNPEELAVLDLKNNKKVVFSGGGSLLASTSGFMMNLVSDPSAYDRVYKNYDFAATQLEAGTPSRFMVKYDESVREPHTITFVNCRFPYLTFSNKLRHTVRWKFYHCTFTDGVAVSNAEFYDCQFGSDAAAADVQCDYDTLFENCFFWYGNDYVGGRGLHADGIQISGIKDDLAGNISLHNCVFEIIYLKKGGESGHPNQDIVNACIMIQPDYGPVDNVLVEDCYVNGGGYTVYCHPRAASITNVNFRNMTYGCSMRWRGVLYPKTPEVYGWENVQEANALRVGSVWNENGTIQVSVTNDTNQSRTLKIVTNLGTTEVNIPACPKYDQLSIDTLFSDLPFNLLTQIDAEGVQWVQCYEGGKLLRTAVI